MDILRRIYSIYVLLVFIVTFLLLLPFFLIVIAIKQWHVAGHYVNKYWARVFFTLCFMPYKVEIRGKIDRSSNYIFCPNHASFLDIPIMGLAPLPFAFVGKVSIAKAPLFGYMFRKLHITVDRDSLRGRYQAQSSLLEAIDQGWSLTIFPEGGIFSKNPPHMIKFKNGAFKAAIEKQIPIIPVTIPYNWIALPDDGRFLLRRRPLSIIFHEPIPTVGLTADHVQQLKDRTFAIIDKELKKWNGPK